MLRLDEVIAEKLRAVLGQRRFAIARDLYDIHQLLATGVNASHVRAALPAKLKAKALERADLSVDRMVSRKGEFLADWTRNLSPLVQADALPAFEDVWQETAAFLQTVLRPELLAE